MIPPPPRSFSLLQFPQGFVYYFIFTYCYRKINEMKHLGLTFTQFTRDEWNKRLEIENARVYPKQGFKQMRNDQSLSVPFAIFTSGYVLSTLNNCSFYPLIGRLKQSSIKCKIKNEIMCNSVALRNSHRHTLLPDNFFWE